MTDKEKYAETLRNNPTGSEVILRDALLARGYTFQFQAVVGGYIPDFYFADRKKVIELDGKRFHDPVKDRRRDGHLRKLGIATFRIRSHRVYSDLRQVLRSIDVFINKAVLEPRKPKKKKGKEIKSKASPGWKRKVPKVLVIGRY